MGRAPDKQPRKTPNRIYATMPESEASRVISLGLKPMHLWMLHRLQPDAKTDSRKVQVLIEQIAGEAGITIEDWKKCQEEEKSQYFRGRRTATPDELERRKRIRKEGQ